MSGNNSNIIVNRRWEISKHTVVIAVLMLTLFVTTIDMKRCVADRCNCRVISNKYFASCEGINLRSLPSCEDVSTSERSDLEEIQAINISGNHFNDLSAEFFHRACLNNLQKIYIQQVQLQTIHNDAFNPLKNIIELSLATNFLRHVPSRSLENLIHLRVLDLSENNIGDIKNSSFVTLRSLRTLLLDGNRISHIEQDAFKGLSLLETIRLNGNRLTTIKAEVFMSLPALHTLYLENNDWKCNCKLQPFKRMLLLKSHLTIQDNPVCSDSFASLNSMNLENFQCSPRIQANYSDTQVVIGEGSTMKLRCATFVETFGDETADYNYLTHTKITWSWNGAIISNNSRGADEISTRQQQFVIEESIPNWSDRIKIKVSSLLLSSVMPFNGGNYLCNVSNTAGVDNLNINVRVIPFKTDAVHSNDYESRNIVPAASSSPSSSSLPALMSGSNSFTRTKVIAGDNGDHILFGLVFGILCGIFIVLVIFSIILVVFFRKHRDPNTNGIRRPHELSNVESGSNDDNHTFDEAVETNTNSTVDKIAMVGGDFNPLIVNPVQKPPRLGIPDVSSLYSHPSWTLDRNNGFGNRSRYASYAETEPLYSDYYTIYRPNRQMAKIDENRTFISDTASEV